MKRIIIKSIHMVNFRGFPDKEIEFDMNGVSIKGMNATGKSTIAIAFNWLLFGKDQFGRTDFEVKPLTESGEPLHQVDSEVSAKILVGEDSLNMDEITLKKVYHERWTKPKGKAEPVFSGHETLYYWNGVPVTMREYNTKIENVLCPEELFRLLTNPLRFPSMNWQAQRKLLFEIAGDVSDTEVASQKKAWTELFNTINGHKTLEEYRREIAMEKRKTRDDLDKIPARIDEVAKAIPAVKEDWAAIEKSINEKSNSIRAIDKEISDISAGMKKQFDAYRSKQVEINKKRSTLQSLEFKWQKDISLELTVLLAKDNEYKGRAKNIEDELQRIDRSVKNLVQERGGMEGDRDELRRQYHEMVKEKEVFFLDEELICPTCKRPLEADDVEAKKNELMAQYNSNKAQRISRNISQGKELTSQIGVVSDKIMELINKADLLGAELSGLEVLIMSNREAIKASEKGQNKWKEACEKDPEYQKILSEIKDLEKTIANAPARVDISDQTAAKEVIQAELKDLIQRLNNKEFIERASSRITELGGEQQRLSQLLADLEKIEFNISEFVRAKTRVVEEKINSMFSIVRFKMFDQQVNGEVAETCEIMVDGVPWAELNNAMKINSGVDVMKTLSNHYGIYPPCWFDNAEALNEIIPMDTQTIKLYVTDDKTLTISN
jgi:DNA repair protein SbcC/Rad50